MERPVRRFSVYQRWEDCPPGITGGLALVETPGKWAGSVISLVKGSKEFRHSGLLVTNVGPGSQGARSGMRRGDVLLRYEDQELDTVATLRRLAKGYTQGAAAQKPIRIDAARLADELVFDVVGGTLGITVSPFLHRRMTRKSPWKRILQALGAVEADHRVMPNIVHTLEELRRHDPNDPVLVVVPGDLARPVLGVLRALTLAGSRKRRKRAESLLLAARHLG